MRLIILGPPGAGKGTQSEFIVEHTGALHLSTGDIFRENIKNGTPLGKRAKEYMDRGALVPDEVVNDIVTDRIKSMGPEGSFLLDGFPRTVNQAVALDGALEEIGVTLDCVININVDKEALIQRIVGRRVCPTCGKSYHVTHFPPKVDGVCDDDGTQLIQRDDDQEETVRHRIDVYERQTTPLIDYYKAQDNLVDIDGNQSVQEVKDRILAALQGVQRA
ncbi:MAG: adenylate kinase [Tissierellia bacterium]|nr:adenylate kinase [Tissierellia bacterium]